MDIAKRKRLERAGWKVGTTQEFLGLSDAEASYVEMKLRLARAFAARRTKRRVTQAQVAKLLKSSQSRVAKIEAGDPSVSADLIIRSLLALGCTSRDVATAIGKG
jgi:predicted XRE-type DNA-binding protein